MKLKLDENGNAVLKNGMPVYIRDDGTESEIDVAGMARTITARNAEAKANRERYEAAETTLKTFEGISDPAEAVKALSTVKNLDAKKLVDAGEVEKVRQEAIKAVEAQYKPKLEENERLKAQLVDEKIGGAFARSPLIVGEKAKLAIPADIVQARFGKHFAIGDDGKVVATDAHGNKIYSKANPGDIAGFDDALEQLIEQYPGKDSILKSTQGSGGGAAPSGKHPSNPGGKQITRSQFDGLDPAGRAQHMKTGGAVIDD
jgi:hypothetical protein